ncbi:MAG: hypothetical protein ACLQJR_21465 [Stellaceae bacterium]
MTITRNNANRLAFQDADTIVAAEPSANGATLTVTILTGSGGKLWLSKDQASKLGQFLLNCGKP